MRNKNHKDIYLGLNYCLPFQKELRFPFWASSSAMTSIPTFEKDICFGQAVLQNLLPNKTVGMPDGFPQEGTSFLRYQSSAVLILLLESTGHQRAKLVAKV